MTAPRIPDAELERLLVLRSLVRHALEADAISPYYAVEFKELVRESAEAGKPVLVDQGGIP